MNRLLILCYLTQTNYFYFVDHCWPEVILVKFILFNPGYLPVSNFWFSLDFRIENCTFTGKGFHYIPWHGHHFVHLKDIICFQHVLKSFSLTSDLENWVTWVQTLNYKYLWLPNWIWTGGQVKSQKSTMPLYRKNAINSTCLLQDTSLSTLWIMSNKKHHPADDILNYCLK